MHLLNFTEAEKRHSLHKNNNTIENLFISAKMYKKVIRKSVLLHNRKFRRKIKKICDHLHQKITVKM